jgi:hypothetical protein
MLLVRTALACAAAASAQAAPLDALLTALPPSAPLRWETEASYDMANRSVDVLGLRPKRADGTYGPSGDYRGAHLLVGWQWMPELRLEGGLWQRSVAYVSAAAEVTTWQIAGQWRVLQWTTGDTALALRLGGWGNRAPLLSRTSSAVVQGTTFTSAQATNPRDMQLQLDLVGSWQPSAEWQTSAFVGVGRSQVDFDRVSATAKSGNGCVYDVQFEGGKVIAVCEMGGTTTRISTPADVYGINVDTEARYSAHFFSTGANVQWQRGDWRLRAGVQYLQLQRQSVDDIVLARGGQVFRSNTVGVTDFSYRVLPASWVFLRAQVLAHQFVGEAPLMYNSLTATQHRRRYGIATVGLSHSF